MTAHALPGYGSSDIVAMSDGPARVDDHVDPEAAPDDVSTGRVTPGLGHGALLYDGPGEFVEVAAAWVEEGLGLGDEVAVIAPGTRAGALAARLGARADEVAFLSAEAMYHDVSPLFRRAQSLADARDPGDPRLRLVVEHPRVGTSRMIAGELREYLHLDALCTAAFAREGISCLCAFRRDALSDGQVEEVAAAHPSVRREGRVSGEGHLPPATLIARGQRRVGAYVTPGDGGTVAIRTAADVARARDLVRTTAVDDRISDEVGRLTSFLVAVSEIATNALTHAGGGTATAWVEDGRLVCDVADDGPGLPDPLAGYGIAPAGARGGRGLWLARQLTTLLEVGRRPDGTLVRMHLAGSRRRGGRRITPRAREPETP
jgi:anti-sigma regulatory factor (Ser/Thr protein kinase)